MYTTRLTATLSGATVRQLAYWRRETEHGPLLSPEYGSSPRALYSFRDVVALRICVRLRKETSLQRVRRSLASLQEFAPQTHLSSHTLKSAGRTIVWLTEDGDYIDTVEQPGHPGIPVVMEEVFRSFTTADGRTVPDLSNPEDGLSIDNGVRGGYPVLEGTRIPYDTVASLAQDGLSEADIIDLYPSVAAAGIQGAVKFADLVALTDPQAEPQTA
jgi:uncharacterized protein (DUF433 family)/DNA-binding transcriptional MerR regulator